MKFLPVGLSSFSKIIEKNSIYVDKTNFIYDLITQGSYYFISRPRRFGKSLLISTFEEVFNGNRNLFKDLLIDKSDYDWQPHPVIRIDLSTISKSTPQNLHTGLLDRLNGIARNNKVDLSAYNTLEGKFSTLIEQLAKHNQVVILVDEYDKPILDHIDAPEKAEAQRAVLQEFYGVIKGHDEHIRFVMLTGVTKFTKTTIFSGLNNLSDITFDERYATLFGYTHEEIEQNFEPHTAKLATKLGLSTHETLELLRTYYDGYQFYENAVQVYNPFSVLNCLEKSRFKGYWYATGTSSFLTKLLRKNEYSIDGILNPAVSESSLDECDITDIALPTLLLQAGYLTIDTFDPRTHTYTLKVPNREVNDALTGRIIDALTGYKSTSAINYATLFFRAFEKNDMPQLLDKLQEFLNKMPYHTHIKDEEMLRTIFFSIFTLIGIQVEPEVATSRGRADLVVTIPQYMYIIELKVDKTAQEALDQIQRMEYANKFKGAGKQLVLIGLSFDRTTRKLSMANVLLP